MVIIIDSCFETYKKFLIENEKSKATIEKYLHDVKEFSRWLNGKSFEKVDVLMYKALLAEKFAPSSANTALSSLNSFFTFMEWYSLRVKKFKIQKKIFLSSDRELNIAEYERLLLVAKEQKNQRLYLLMQTICAIGIRVSELRYITVESVHTGIAEISCKGKQRQVFLPKQLCDMLKSFAHLQNIKYGPIFLTKNRNPIDRSNIWSDMKKLCKLAHVSEQKVFPHNLRHLFARTYYGCQKDIVRLSDILGHSNVNTTRIYTMESGEIHAKQIQNLGLLRC